MGTRMNKRRVLVGVAGMAMLVAACGYGETQSADQVSDVSARLNGLAQTTLAGTTTYVFEYGPTVDYGSVTETGTVEIPDTSMAVPVSATITGLAEATEYHYRICAYASDGAGSCGDDMTVTTTAGRDSVTGTGHLLLAPESGLAVGGSLDVNSSADGSFPVGWASVGIFAGSELGGEVTCMRIEANRAAIGFLADGEPQVPMMVIVEDNGPAGDRWSAQQLDATAETCPVPTIDDFAPIDLGGGPIEPVVTAGDFIVHDHIDEL